MKEEPVTSPAQAHVDALHKNGFCLIPEAAPVALVEALSRDLHEVFLRTPNSSGAFYGERTVRFGAILSRSIHAAPIVQQPLILAIAQAILGPWCDNIQLNLTQAIEIGSGAPQQVPHRDQDMWPASRMLPAGHGVEFLLNVMWPFTPYRPKNGSTMIWPGSHCRCSEDLIDPREAISLDIDPGTALLFLGSTLHAGGANRTHEPRRGMIVSYSLGWLKPYELQTLAYPPEKARDFPSDLARLVGYQIHRPNLGNVEGRCPSLLLNDDTGGGAIDALAEPQLDLIKAYRAQNCAFLP